MRLAIIFACLSLTFGCSGNRIADAQTVTELGLIVAKETVDLEGEIDVDTRVFASVSSGGRFSIGLGFLLSPLFNGAAAEAVRYQIKLIDGSEMTIYHPSREFEIDDCVEITIYPDETRNPPRLRREPGACTAEPA